MMQLINQRVRSLLTSVDLYGFRGTISEKIQAMCTKNSMYNIAGQFPLIYASSELIWLQRQIILHLCYHVKLGEETLNDFAHVYMCKEL